MNGSEKLYQTIYEEMNARWKNRNADLMAFAERMVAECQELERECRRRNVIIWVCIFVIAGLMVTIACLR